MMDEEDREVTSASALHKQLLTDFKTDLKTGLKNLEEVLLPKYLVFLTKKIVNDRPQD